MRQRFISFGICGILFCSLLTLVGPQACADTSNDINNPTQIVLNPGSNFLTDDITLSEAETLVPGTGDLDFFTLIVPSGLQLDSILVTESDAFSSAFFGFAAGPTLDGNPAVDDAGREAFVNQALGFTLINTGSVGTNLLPELSTGTVAGQLIDPIRFDGNAPLPSGEYAFVLQNRQDDVLSFTFDFQASSVSVPEPASAGILLLIGGFGLMRRHRRAV